MRRYVRQGHIKKATVFAAIAVLLALPDAPAHANWLTHLAREAGEVGGKGAAHLPSHLGPLGKAAAHIKGLVDAPKGTLAAHATAEGHWQFINREGNVFTAGTASEMERVLPTLVPDAAATETKLSLYLSEDSVFANRSALDSLPGDASLHIVTDNAVVPVARGGASGAERLTARLRPNLAMDLVDKRSFDEVVHFLGRRLNKSEIRTIAVEAEGPKFIRSAPALDPATKVPLVDVVAGDALVQSFSTIKGQTALLTGRVDDGRLFFTHSSGGEMSLDIQDVVAAARDADVNLILLRNESGRQAGGRNWLWQTFEVGGLKQAAESATLGDFLDALAGRRGTFRISAASEDASRIQISAVPDGGTGVVSEATTALQDTIDHLLGEVVTHSVDIYARDESSQSELDARIIPGVPTYVQIPYLVGLVAGLLAWGTARGWWARIWPPAIAPQGGRGLRLVRALPRECIYFLAFLPVAGVPAVLWQALLQTWLTFTAPFRWLHRKFFSREV